MKKILPIAFVVVLAIVAIFINRYNTNSALQERRQSTTKSANANSQRVQFDRRPAKFFFTSHARCRMECRKITQREVKEILAGGTINYNKSNLDDPRGPTYAVEGTTDDRQRVRIIFAPKQQHMSVVTVIDLEEDHKCNCD